MPESLAIDLDQLRNALVRVLDACEERFGRHVTVNGDDYWHLPPDAAFDMSEEPTEFTVGQLSDDLQAVASDIGDPLTAWHDIAHIIGLLRALEVRARP